jgi:hypothetical protein
MSYDKKLYNDADRSKFQKAMAAEGISLSPYIKNGLHRERWVDNIINRRMYKRMYTPQRRSDFTTAGILEEHGLGGWRYDPRFYMRSSGQRARPLSVQHKQLTPLHTSDLAKQKWKR